MERTSGFQPVYCLGGDAENQAAMLLVVRVYRMTTSPEGAFLGESVKYETTFGMYLGEGRWALRDGGGELWRDHRSEQIYRDSEGCSVCVQKEIAAWCRIYGDSVDGGAFVRRIDRGHAPLQELGAAG